MVKILYDKHDAAPWNLYHYNFTTCEWVHIASFSTRRHARNWRTVIVVEALTNLHTLTHTSTLETKPNA